MERHNLLGNKLVKTFRSTKSLSVMMETVSVQSGLWSGKVLIAANTVDPVSSARSMTAKILLSPLPSTASMIKTASHKSSNLCCITEKHVWIQLENLLHVLILIRDHKRYYLQ